MRLKFQIFNFILILMTYFHSKYLNIIFGKIPKRQLNVDVIEMKNSTHARLIKCEISHRYCGECSNEIFFVFLFFNLNNLNKRKSVES
jgi:hypothetical protein